MARPGQLVLLGHPVAHSLSPRFQNALLEQAGIPLRYEAVDVAPEAVAERIAELRAASGAGNVTVPHKEAVAALCDRLTPLATRVGAVNCFWSAGASLVGDNTDVGGFRATVRALLPEQDAPPRVVLLGAGGAAAAVLAACEALGVQQVALVARTPERAQRLSERFAPIARVVASPSRGEVLAEATLVVNATPIGLEGETLPLDPAALNAHAAVIDLTYRRGETPLVHACRARGLRATDGLTMLVEQGALAFERWFPGALTPETIRAVIWDAVGERR